MPRIGDLERIPRRVLPVFFVLDVSGTMSGPKISVLNHAMAEMVTAMKMQAMRDADAELKAAFLTFGSGCKWLNPDALENMDGDFVWRDLAAEGTADMGAALRELGDKLSRTKFLQSDVGFYLPVIIFVTDGHAGDNYEEALKELRRNEWFMCARKIGFAVGDDTDIDTLCNIVGSLEDIWRVPDIEYFAGLIRFDAILATQSTFCSYVLDKDVTPEDGVAVLNVASEDSTAVPDATTEDEKFDETEAVAADAEETVKSQRVLHMFYVLDTSNSMAGEKIVMLNSAMEELIAEMRRTVERGTDAEVKFAVLTCSAECQWMDPDGPKSVEEGFAWKQLQAGGLCDVGTVLKELNEKLSENAYLGNMKGKYLPIIIFVMGGCATDCYMEELQRLRENRWFQCAIKIGYAVDDSPGLREMLCDIVGNSEAVFDSFNSDIFPRLLRFVETEELIRSEL